ncbi:YolD-like family protein [Filibacter tadaridae]|uniref:YolD-like protein n=1 Tax=Filibacter tadaridae TaxID=2483811 RepID=A0A3P5XM54_9BACL|nr:YolD-like family protein [Filibacter tadaridae]VDC28860.1 YolD-like protein [Filibacter tadaridae]
MNRDRGNIKWTAMMLTEHLVKLRDWVAEDAYEEKPTIDEWTFQEFQQQLDIAYQSKCELIIKTWASGEFTDSIGILQKRDLRLHLIYLTDGVTVRKINVHTIVGIQTIGFE